MGILIAANYENVSDIKKSFSSFARVKGTFPSIKCCHELVNKYKYELDPSTTSGGISSEYPQNFLHELKELLDTYDMVIIPMEGKLLAAAVKYKKIKRICIYDPENDNPEMRDLLW